MEFVNEIHGRGDAHKKPAHVRRKHRAEKRGSRDRDEDEHDQHIGREQRHAPILVVAEAHLVVGEELVMVERVPLVKHPQRPDIHRAVHEIFVNHPLENVGEQKRERNGEPFPRRHIMDVLDVDVESCRHHCQHGEEVEIAVVPAHDAGPVFLPKCNLPLTDHIFECALTNSSMRSPVIVQSLSRFAITSFMNGSESSMARSFSPK